MNRSISTSGLKRSVPINLEENLNTHTKIQNYLIGKKHIPFDLVTFFIT